MVAVAVVCLPSTPSHLSPQVPFKPKVAWRPGEFMLPGGSFPLPPAAQDLCQVLQWCMVKW